MNLLFYVIVFLCTIFLPMLIHEKIKNTRIIQNIYLRVGVFVVGCILILWFMKVLAII